MLCLENQRVWLPVKRCHRHTGTKEAVRATSHDLFETHTHPYIHLSGPHIHYTQTHACAFPFFTTEAGLIALFGAFPTEETTTTAAATFLFRVSAVQHSNICQTSEQRDGLLCRSRGLTGSEEWPKSVGLGGARSSAVQR